MRDDGLDSSVEEFKGVLIGVKPCPRDEPIWRAWRISLARSLDVGWVRHHKVVAHDDAFAIEMDEAILFATRRWRSESVIRSQVLERD